MKIKLVTKINKENDKLKKEDIDKNIMQSNTNDKNKDNIEFFLSNVSGNKKEEIIYNYENCNIEKSKTINSFMIKNDIEYIYRLKDERLIILDDCNILYVYSLKNDKLNCDIKTDFLIDVRDVIELDDGNLILSENKKSKIILIKLKEKDIEIIPTIEINFNGVFSKLSKINPLGIKGHTMYFYSYENGKIFERYVDDKIIKNKSSFDIPELKNGKFNYYNFIDFLPINEHENAIYHDCVGMLGGVTDYILFYNLLNYKKIESITIGTDKNKSGSKFCLFDKNNLLVGQYTRILLIDLKKNKIKSKFKIDAQNVPSSIISLNEKDFLIFIEHKDGNYVEQFEINRKGDINYKGKKKMKYESYLVGKCNVNKIIIKQNKVFLLD